MIKHMRRVCIVCVCVCAVLLKRHIIVADEFTTHTHTRNTELNMRCTASSATVRPALLSGLVIPLQWFCRSVRTTTDQRRRGSDDALRPAGVDITRVTWTISQNAK